jgi:hypothetical protein
MSTTTNHVGLRMNMMPNSNSKDDISSSSTDMELILQSSQTLQRFSWLSWWSQVILTVVSSVILLFARNVTQRSSKIGGSGSGFALTGLGIVVSILSILWTWGGARLGQKLATPSRRHSLPPDRILAATMIRRVVTVGISINLLGMTLGLLGSGQIVGGLAIQVLTLSSSSSSSLLQQGQAVIVPQLSNPIIQPLDILIVQGNTNILLSHFGSLVAFLYQTKLVHRLDPPSKEGNVRMMRGTKEGKGSK